jgi:hypothetical protein
MECSCHQLQLPKLRRRTRHSFKVIRIILCAEISFRRLFFFQQQQQHDEEEDDFLASPITPLLPNKKGRKEEERCVGFRVI